MIKNGVEKEWFWYPLKWFGIDHPYAAVHAPTIINTWIALGVLIIAIAVAGYFLLAKPLKAETYRGIDSPPPQAPIISAYSYGRYVITWVIRSFIKLNAQSAGTFVYRYFAFSTSLFLFIIFCNWVGLLPFVEEPTKNLNTTLALGIITLLYIQKEIIQIHGFKRFLKDYLLPVDTFFPLNLIIGLAMLPLKILGELASVISLSFRLFGNIFGGTIIMELIHATLGNSLVLNSIATLAGLHIVLAAFFIIFEGALQAFVFTILALTTISMAASAEGGH